MRLFLILLFLPKFRANFSSEKNKYYFESFCSLNFIAVILMANTSRQDFPSIPIVREQHPRVAENYDTLKTVADILIGKLGNSNRKNLTLHIDTKFQKLWNHEKKSPKNSTDTNKPNCVIEWNGIDCQKFFWI